MLSIYSNWKEQYEKRAQMAKQRSKELKHYKQVIESLVLSPEELGPMLQKLHDLGSMGDFAASIKDGILFPEFKNKCDQHDFDIDLYGILVESMHRLAGTLCQEYSTGGKYLSLPIFTLCNSDKLPILPEGIENLPWFVLFAESLLDVGLGSSWHIANSRHDLSSAVVSKELTYNEKGGKGLFSHS
ncbi:hypothetical protein TWF694_011584 [Orbilia ellipsospora]|uniref:Uncharacterized protein n=1 Tax=Orbilia ellipsospora TaxID=2528407 RepID=A0AAV9X8L4_9PEZI